MKFTPGTPGEGSTLPDGEHPFEVSNAGEKVSNSSGNDMLELILNIKGHKVYDYLVSSDGSEWKITNFLASIGEPFKPGIAVDLDPERLIGRKGTCVLYTDTYQGKKKNKVSDYVFVVSGPGAQPPAKDKWR
jgi:hypothetical protein